MNTKQELVLIKRAQKGEREAVGELWDEITPILYGYLCNTLRHKETADDILQETWIKAIKALPSYRPRGIRFRAWLFAIAKNECRQHWRKAKRETPESVEVIEANSPHKAGAGETQEHTILVESAMKHLNEDEQEILRLRYLADFSFHEVAALLGISSITARVRVHRTLGKARSFLNR